MGAQLQSTRSEKQYNLTPNMQKQSAKKKPV
jgi:hypothetical protein